jgi:hypothetical protein
MKNEPKEDNENKTKRGRVKEKERIGTEKKQMSWE